MPETHNGGIRRQERQRAVWCATEFPHSIWYSTARPVGLLVERGVDVQIVTARPGRNQVDGVPIHSAPSLVQMAWTIRRLRPQALFLESPCGALTLSLLCSRTWVRTPIASESAAKLWLQRRLAARVASLSVTNPHDDALWPSDARDDVPYPVDTSFWSTPEPQDPGFWSRWGWSEPAGQVVSYVSNLLPRKAQVDLVNWLAPVLAEQPDRCLVLAGSSFDDDYVAAVQAAVTRLGLGSQVLLTGGLSALDVRQLFSWTDLHIVNTTAETQCMAVFESLAAGVATLIRDIPVLTTAFPGLPAHAGAADLQASVRRLLGDPLGRDQILAGVAERLRWADVQRHDRLVLTRAQEWGLL